MPSLLGGVVTRALALPAADLPVARPGVSAPASWSAQDWASDVVPHLPYGLVTHGLLSAAEHRPCTGGPASDSGWRSPGSDGS